MSTVFDNIVSGSSSTARVLQPYRYSDSEALAFVSAYGDTKILGDNDWWFNHTLSEYVDDKGIGWPPHGIIVKPAGDNTLVWFDNSGRLVVINLNGYVYETDFVESVKNPEYFEDPRYLELWNNILPTIPNTMMLFGVLVVGLVVILSTRRR